MEMEIEMEEWPKAKALELARQRARRTWMIQGRRKRLEGESRRGEGRGEGEGDSGGGGGSGGRVARGGSGGRGAEPAKQKAETLPSQDALGSVPGGSWRWGDGAHRSHAKTVTARGSAAELAKKRRAQGRARDQAQAAGQALA